MQCTEFERVLEQQPDGPLSAAASLHRDSCAGCGALWADLDAIRAAGREIGAESPAPPARIWVSLRARLEAEGLIREPNRLPWFVGWFGSPLRLGMAGAYLVFILVAGTLVGNWNYQPMPASFQADAGVSGAWTPVTPELRQALDGDVKRVLASLPEGDADLAASLQQNLSIVDNFIAACEKSVREQPDNPVALDYLNGAYRQKAVLLATAADRSTMEDQ
jgi:hypothetical protein